MFEIYVQLDRGREVLREYQYVPRIGDILKVDKKEYQVTKVTALEKGQLGNYAAAINADSLEA